jgi:Zn-finger nucleic acid-binding protein
MRCPVDGTTLALAERAGVEIDYCPQCRGLWLDRGELDRIIERSSGHDRVPTKDAHHDRYRYEHDQHEHEDDHDRRHNDDDDYRVGQEARQPKRRGRFSALTDLLGGGDG